MKLYRCIGESELKMLLNGSIIYGKYNCNNELQNDNNKKNACCFFVDEMMWKDKQHKYLIVVDIPTEELDFGIGTYHAAKSLMKTKIWTGRDGQEIFKIREAYISSYSISQVVEIFLFGHFANHFVENKIKPICSKYGIIYHHIDGAIPFENSTQYFEKDSFYYRTNENTCEWFESLKFDENDYISKTKKLVNETNLTLEQARTIRNVLRMI